MERGLVRGEPGRHLDPRELTPAQRRLLRGARGEDTNRCAATWPDQTARTDATICQHGDRSAGQDNSDEASRKSHGARSGPIYNPVSSGLHWSPTPEASARIGLRWLLLSRAAVADKHSFASSLGRPHADTTPGPHSMTGMAQLHFIHDDREKYFCLGVIRRDTSIEPELRASGWQPLEMRDSQGV
ncbi:unnamed protein product [Lampetra planeri]